MKCFGLLITVDKERKRAMHSGVFVKYRETCVSHAQHLNNLMIARAKKETIVSVNSYIHDMKYCNYLSVCFIICFCVSFHQSFVNVCCRFAGG